MVKPLSQLEKNLEHLSHYYQDLAVRLDHIDYERTKILTNDLGNNLQIQLSDHAFLLYENPPKKSVLNDIQSLCLDGLEVCYIYGVGLGYHFEALIERLSKNKNLKIYFLEDDLEVIKRLLETEIGSKLIRHKQVVLLYFNEKTLSLISQKLAWMHLNRKINVFAIASYKKDKLDIFKKLEEQILFDAAQTNALVDEYLNYGIVFFKNFYPNLLNIGNSYFGNRLFKKFKNVPAVICGAGPSLNKNIKLLDRYKDQALIFAGGSAINVFSSYGITPHFCGGIDPNFEQFKRFSAQNSFETPYFYRLRIQKDALEQIHGFKLLITGSGGYSISKWFEKELGIEEKEISEGFNITHFLLEIAKALGCDPIIFAGMDLAFTEDKFYAGDVKTEGETLDEREQTTAKDIFGNEVKTQWKWIAESEWIASYAKENRKMTFINATEGGIGFEGIKNIDLDTVFKEKLKNRYDLSGYLHAALQCAGKVSVSQEKVVQLMQVFSKSLEKSISFLENLIKGIKEGKDLESDPFLILAESDLKEEVSYQYLLKDFEEIFSHILDAQRLKDVLEQKKKVEQDDKKSLFQFLSETAQINKELIKRALLEKKEKKTFFQETCSKQEEEVVALPKFIEQGKIEIYDSKKRLLSLTEIKHWLRDGKAEFYYLSGKVYAKLFYKENQLEGEQRFYYENGNIKTKACYKKGKLEGGVCLYYEDGSVKKELFFKHGKRVKEF